MALIEAKKISLGYDGTDIVNNLSFKIDKGDYLCIVGENGSGKSTLIKALLGLKKTSGGHLHFLGVKPSQIGYLPQSAETQKDFPASVGEIVMSGFSGKKNIFGIYSKKDRVRAFENMKLLGIDELSRRCYRELSGGQKQRVLLARALCATESLLLLDEPVTGLDPMAAEELYYILYHLNRDHKITIIMVSHDTSASLKYASHILHLGRNDSFFGDKLSYKNSDLGKSFAGGEYNE